MDRLLHKTVLLLMRRKDSTLSIIQKGRGANATRTMFYNNTVFSFINLSTIYTHCYWDYFLPLPSAFSKPHILILGFGGGTISYQMYNMYGKNIDIDAVEIDKDIIHISKEFLIKEIKVNIINEDALVYLKTTKKRYDIIIADLYIGNKIPSKFLSTNFIKICKSHLKHKGIFATNFAFSTENSSQYKPYVSKNKKIFDSLYTINPILIPGNAILIAFNNIQPKSFLKSIEEYFPHNKKNRFLMNAYRKVLG